MSRSLTHGKRGWEGASPAEGAASTKVRRYEAARPALGKAEMLWQTQLDTGAGQNLRVQGGQGRAYTKGDVIRLTCKKDPCGCQGDEWV